MLKLFSAILLGWISVVHAAEEKADAFPHPIYFGGLGGWGSTTWQGLVPSVENQNSAISISTPVSVEEGGGVWGLSLGYEVTPYFAFEGNRMSFPGATLTFDEYSLYAFDHDSLILHTETQTISLSAKIMLIIPKTTVRAFSGFGVAGVFRKDQLNVASRASPTFMFGFNALLTDRVMFEIGSNYIAGYGESEINPVQDFIPFLYSVYGKIVLRFG